jgi:hypothetical protein
MNDINRGIKPASLTETTVIVRGFDHTCWKCHKAMTCVIAIHAEGAKQSDDWVWFEDKHALVFARDLLLHTGQDRLAAAIKERFSKTAGDSYLSNGYPHCDAIQGDWPLGEEVSDYGQSAPLEELPVLATAKVATTLWQDVAVNQNVGRYGYPMTWEDIG